MLRLLLWRCCDWSKRHGRHCTISGLHTFWFLTHGGNGVTSDKAPCLAFVRTYMLVFAFAHQGAAPIALSTKLQIPCMAMHCSLNFTCSPIVNDAIWF